MAEETSYESLGNHYPGHIKKFFGSNPPLTNNEQRSPPCYHIYDPLGCTDGTFAINRENLNCLFFDSARHSAKKRYDYELLFKSISELTEICYEKNNSLISAFGKAYDDWKSQNVGKDTEITKRFEKAMQEFNALKASSDQSRITSHFCIETKKFLEEAFRSLDDNLFQDIFSTFMQDYEQDTEILRMLLSPTNNVTNGSKDYNLMEQDIFQTLLLINEGKKFEEITSGSETKLENAITIFKTGEFKKLGFSLKNYVTVWKKNPSESCTRCKLLVKGTYIF